MITFREFRKINDGQVNPLQNIEIQIDNLFDELKKKIHNPENSRSKWMNEYYEWIGAAKREYKWNSLHEYNSISKFTEQFQEALKTVTISSPNYTVVNEYKSKMKQMVRSFMPSVVIEDYIQNASLVLEKYDVPLEKIIEWYKEDGHNLNAEELEQVIVGLCESIWSDIGHGALKGAGVGAGTGAAAGGIFGGFPGAGIGAGLGGLAGGAAGGLYGLGRNLWNKWKNRNQTVKPDYQGLLNQLKNDNKDNPEIVNAVNKLVNTLANANNTSTTAPPVTAAPPVKPSDPTIPVDKKEPIPAPTPVADKKEPIPPAPTPVANKPSDPTIPVDKKEPIPPAPTPVANKPSDPTIPVDKKEPIPPAPVNKKEEPIPPVADKKKEPIPPAPVNKKEEPIPPVADKEEPIPPEEIEKIKLGASVLMARKASGKADVSKEDVDKFSKFPLDHEIWLHKKDKALKAADEYLQSQKPDSPPTISTDKNQGITPPKEKEHPKTGPLQGAPPPIPKDVGSPGWAKTKSELRDMTDDEFKKWVLLNTPESVPETMKHYDGENSPTGWWHKVHRNQAISELPGELIKKKEKVPMPPPPSGMVGQRPTEHQLVLMKPNEFRNFLLNSEPDLAASYEGQPWYTQRFRLELIDTLKHLWKDNEVAKQSNDNANMWHNESLQYKVNKYKEMLQNSNRPEITLHEVARLPLSERAKFYKNKLSCRGTSLTT